MVTLPAAVLRQYAAFSRYNSPYPAHAEGRAIDLYPEDGAPSPVAGEVIDARTVRAPDHPYAPPHDHVLVIDTGRRLARVLHVDPAVAAGETVAVGDDLGETVRSGYFAPWVDDHLHLGFRPYSADPYRATGSLPVTVDAPVEPVPWDGEGRVVERGETYAVLDAPGHPAPGERFAGIAAGGGALDGGCPHYDGGGVIGGSDGAVRLAGERVGVAADGRVRWDDVTVRANGRPVTGLSLSPARVRLGVKIVSRGGIGATAGERVAVTVDR